MTLEKWNEVLVETPITKRKDMTYSFTFKNQQGRDIWGTKIRPLAGARQFLAGVGLKKNVDYDYTADKRSGQYCYKFKNPENALLFRLWVDGSDAPKKGKSQSKYTVCPNCGHHL